MDIPQTAAQPTFGWGRRAPVPRSVRIVNMPETGHEKDPSRKEPTEQSRIHQGRVPRGAAAAFSPTLFTSSSPTPPPPRFRAPALHLELLRNPSIISHIRYVLFPIIVFAHIPLQAFLDFNVVFILLQYVVSLSLQKKSLSRCLCVVLPFSRVAKFPNPVAPGVPGSGKNWTLAATAYIACFLAWIILVFIIYELIYSFYRRWRASESTKN